MPRIIEDGDEIEVKTVCNMDSIKVLVCFKTSSKLDLFISHDLLQVNSHGSEIGEVFVKDRSSLCNSTLSNSSERILEIRLDEWEKCGVNKKVNNYFILNFPSFSSSGICVFIRCRCQERFHLSNCHKERWNISSCL